MQGREAMVRNEINVLKKVSTGHPNIVTLHDVSHTHPAGLCFGSELNFAVLSRTVF